MKEVLDHKIFHAIRDVAHEERIPAFVIGGFVRDHFLQRPNKDVDIVVLGSGIDMATKVAERLGVKQVNQFKHFGTAMFLYKGWDVEFVGARKESYRSDSRKPIVEDGTLEDDQNRRDFTINAMAFSLNRSSYGELIDPFDGMVDLERKVLRTPMDPDITFSDDPLRMMRAVRFSSQLGFTIDPETLAATARNAHRLSIVSQERITDELNKIILSPIPSRGFKKLFDTKLLHEFFPDMVALQGVEIRDGKGHKDNFYHTLEVLDNICHVTDDIWLRWAAIMHDIAKPQTKKFHAKAGWTFHGHEELGARMTPRIFRQLKLPLDHKMKYVQKLVRLHLRPIALVKGDVTDSAVRRLLFEAGDDIDDLMNLCNADITSKNEMKVRKYRKNFELVQRKLERVEENDRLRNFQPPVTGEMIMNTFEIKPGRVIGEIKEAVKEAILNGDIPNEEDKAYQYMLELGKQKGLKVVENK